MSSSRICCDWIEPEWHNDTEKRSGTGTDIWKIRIVKDQFMLPDILSPDEHAKASRFHHARDKMSFLTRRTALRILLSRYLNIPASDIEFISGENKKPLVNTADNSRLHFNVSHSGDLILIAIAGSAVGIDIERLNPDFNFEEVLMHSFSDQEIRFINGAHSGQQLFYKLWTRKEAITKASSKGLDDDLARIPCLDGSHTLSSELSGSADEWKVSSFKIGDEYQGSIAYQPDTSLTFLNFGFDKAD